MTLLGEFVLPNGGSAWTQTLVAALGAQGISDKAARQELSRTEDRGWMQRERVGRRTRWSLTNASHEVLTSGADRIYRFGTSPTKWDGRWLLLLASTPDSNRAVRYRMAQRLGWAGFGSLGQGVWLSPWTDTEQLVVGVLDEIGISATTFRAEVGALGSANSLSQQAWNLDELRALYDDFLSHIDALRSPSNDVAAGSELTELVHRWRRFPLQDPDLPSELLPNDWPGPEAAKRFAETRHALLPRAKQWWDTLEREHSPPGWEPH